jgi:ribonuclease G
VLDSRREYSKLADTLGKQHPQLKKKITLYTGSAGIFHDFGIESELEKLTKRKVWLKQGGYLVIDQTEAMTIIDVNTGKFIGSRDLEDTVFQTNLEAAAEIARQLRLRDIGGIIIIDFIDMASPEHKEQVLHTLEAALKKDKTAAHVLGFSRLGLVEMTRKKVRQSIADVLLAPCPVCNGHGRIASPFAVFCAMERTLRAYLNAAYRDAQAALIEVHPYIAQALISEWKNDVSNLSRELGLQLYIVGNRNFKPNQHEIRHIGYDEAVRQRYETFVAQQNGQERSI